MQNFKEFSNLLHKNQIRILNERLNNVFKRYNFCMISSQNDIYQYYNINTNIQKSEVIIIDQYKGKNDSPEFFIICFHETLMIINQSSINIMKTFFLMNKKLPIYFLPNSKNSFNEYINIENEQYEIDDEAYTRITNFQQKIVLNCKIPPFYKLFNIISKCFVSYLIKQYFIKQFPCIENSQNTEISNWSSDEFIDLDNYNSGSMFKAILIYHIERNDLFIIKRPINVLDHDNIKLLKRELNIYENFNHYHFPKLYGKYCFEDANNLICPIIEFINGTTLIDIETLGLNFNEKINILLEIMLAIEYIHSNGYFYRDLKPSNVMINQNKHVTLIDFDRVVPCESITDEDDLAARTCDFQSNFVDEDVNKKIISYKNDIFSIGQMFYYVITEKMPNYEIDTQINDFDQNSPFRQLYYECTSSNTDNRPNIIDLIMKFYLSFSNYINNEEPLIKYIKGILINNGKYINKDIKKTIHLLEIASSQNNKYAQFNLGLIYFKNKNITSNFDIAVHYFTLSANQNHSEAQFLLGVLYYYGLSIAQNTDEAIRYFTLSANQNHPVTQYYLGTIYFYSLSVDQNINNAIHYLNLSARQNNSDAQFLLGKIYYEGQYIAKNIEKAFNYFTHSADQNHSGSQYYLGRLYYKGEYVKKNINKAISLLESSAKQGNPDGQFDYGLLFYEGKHVNYDIDKAIHFFKLAAEQNQLDAQCYLGSFYDDGKYIKQDIKKAIYYYSLASNQNHSDAQYNLGLIFYKGISISKDIHKAIQYFELSAKQNNKNAQNILGYIYYIDESIPHDIKKSIYYFSLAANLNDRYAQRNLGNIYNEGILVERDINKAIIFYTLAANQNDQYAQNLLGELYETRDVNKAIKFYELAAKNGNLSAEINLGILFYKGIYTTRDIPRSIYYFERAAKKNSKEAQYYLGDIYMEGKYISKEKAIKYLTLSANQNFAPAQHLLGSIYYFNIFGLNNINKAINYYTLAANQNYKYSEYNLGIIYLRNDIQKAIHYFSKSAYHNYSNAQFVLGAFYITGSYVEKNIIKGIDLIMQASKNKKVEALFYVGFFYHEGEYIEKNIIKSLKFYKEASTFNSFEAKNNIGIIYKNGFENQIKKNIGLAISYFEECITRGNDKLSMYNLAHIYIYEDQHKEQIDKSIKLLIQSINQNFTESVNLLCIALIIKHGYNIENICHDIIKNTNETSKLPSKIRKIINDEELFNDENFYDMYDDYKKIDFIYGFLGQIINYNKLYNKDVYFVIKSGNYPVKQFRENITDDFYDGFGYDILYI